MDIFSSQIYSIYNYTRLRQQILSLYVQYEQQRDRGRLGSVVYKGILYSISHTKKRMNI